ncbi:hypothetical protein EYF80_011901 [Liparis tanakae]|uniref:Uncharacterized protein n=1 Tax=Liparis tanakae TaxID=230148 RepID=A0A4Z2IK46_9TELE|nr:hypothetical protein EYF80_011901 [Liparis tanakae]
MAVKMAACGRLNECQQVAPLDRLITFLKSIKRKTQQSPRTAMLGLGSGDQAGGMVGRLGAGWEQAGSRLGAGWEQAGSRHLALKDCGEHSSDYNTDFCRLSALKELPARSQSGDQESDGQ